MSNADPVKTSKPFLFTISLDRFSISMVYSLSSNLCAKDRYWRFYMAYTGLNELTPKRSWVNDSHMSIFLLNNEVMVMRKAVLQNYMALNTLMVVQEGTCNIIKTKCCVYTPDELKNITWLMTDIKTYILCLTPILTYQLVEWLVWILGSLVAEGIAYNRNNNNLCSFLFLLTRLLWYVLANKSKYNGKV